MIKLITGKPGEGMTYRCLCQDCSAVQVYETQQAQFDAHDEKTFCSHCATGVMCCCSGCLADIEALSVERFHESQLMSGPK